MEIAGIVMKSLIFLCNTAKQLIVPNKKLRHKIQMTNDRPVYILPLINLNVTSFFIRLYKHLLHVIMIIKDINNCNAIL